MKRCYPILVLGLLVASHAHALPRTEQVRRPDRANDRTDDRLFEATERTSAATVDVTFEYQTLEHVAVRVKDSKPVKRADMEFFRKLVAKYRAPTRIAGKSGRQLLLAQAVHVLLSCQRMLQAHVVNLSKVFARCKVGMVVSREERGRADEDFKECALSAAQRLSALQDFIKDIDLLLKKLRCATRPAGRPGEPCGRPR